MMYQGIDWVALGEAAAFAFVLSLVVAALAGLGGALWAIRSRRIMWERYEQERAARGWEQADRKSLTEWSSVYTDEHGNPY